MRNRRHSEEQIRLLYETEESNSRQLLLRLGRIWGGSSW